MCIASVFVVVKLKVSGSRSQKSRTDSARISRKPLLMLLMSAGDNRRPHRNSAHVDRAPA